MSIIKEVLGRLNEGEGDNVPRVGEYQGNLVIIDKWESAWNKPEESRAYWPTGLSVRDYGQFIGQEARYLSRTDGYWEVGSGYGAVKVQIEGGSEAHPIHSETRPLKPPSRGGKDWKWVYKGERWVKDY